MSVYPHPVPEELLDLLRGHRRFWLATHEQPDNDGFGSMLALGLALEAMGREVTMVHNGDGPENLLELPGSDRTLAVDEIVGEAEVVILFDCHRLDRTGPTAARFSGRERVAVIDHHPVGEEGCEGEVCWIVESAAATAVLVQSLLLALDGAGLDRDRATCLYAALVTDTGGFRFDNTKVETFEAAAELVRAGAEPSVLAERYLHQRRPQSLLLLGRVLEQVEYRFGGRVGLMHITRAMLEQSGADLTETEGFVNFLGSTEGVRLVALFKEDGEARWRVSLRANAPHRVDHIARALGGGGHARAAAFVSATDLAEIERDLLTHFGRELERDGGRG